MFPILLSAFTSGVSMAVFFTAIAWFIESTFNSSLLVSVVLSSGYIITFFALPYIGHLTDKTTCKKMLNIIYVAGAFNALVFLIINPVTRDSLLSFIVILLSTAVFTLIRASDQVIRSTYMKKVLPEHKLYHANRLLEMVRQGITFLSGGIAFLILQDKSIQNVCLITLFCFSLSLVINRYIPRDIINEVDESTTPKPKKLTMYHNGYVFFLGDKKRIIELLSLFPYICVVFLNALYPALFTRIGAPVSAYAILVVPYGLGAIIGSMLNTQSWVPTLKSVYIIFGSGFIIGLLLPLLFKSLPAVYICLFVIAFCHSHIRVRRNTLIMTQAESKELARILAFNEVLFICLSTVLSLGLSLIADQLDFWVAWEIVIALNSMVLLLIVLTKNPATEPCTPMESAAEHER
ncbi:H+ Antiporter protein [Serratia quinivorans]|nr:H+ Antiporter protein [Serratia quinivorans]